MVFGFEDAVVHWLRICSLFYRGIVMGMNVKF